MGCIVLNPDPLCHFINGGMGLGSRLWGVCVHAVWPCMGLALCSVHGPGVYMHAVYSVGVYSACGVHVCIYVQCACMVYVLCDIIVMSKLYIDLFIIEQEMGFC